MRDADVNVRWQRVLKQKRRLESQPGVCWRTSLTWATQVNYRIIDIRIHLLLFPQCHSGSNLSGAEKAIGSDINAIWVLTLKHSQADSWLHRLEPRTGGSAASHQGPIAIHGGQHSSHDTKVGQLVPTNNDFSGLHLDASHTCIMGTTVPVKWVKPSHFLLTQNSKGPWALVLQK